MECVSFSDAEGRWGEIIDRAQAGNDVTIMRDGKPAVVIKAVQAEPDVRPPLDLKALRELRTKMTYHGTSAAELIREMRDSRY